MSRQRCAGGIVLDDAARLLVIRRRHEPAAGSWSIPGGRCRPREPAQDACVRELGEETGLVVSVIRWVGRVERPAPSGAVYVIDDYLCRVEGGRLRAGDDAEDVRWAGLDDLRGLSLAPGLWAALEAWSLLPR